VGTPVSTTDVRHIISQTRKALNSIWRHKNITKNRKLYIYQTIIKGIVMYGTGVWQIPTTEISKILCKAENQLDSTI
jgi:hypothetical protein